MQIPRRKFLQFTLGAATMPLALRRAMAGAYPDHPVRVIVGYAAGGPTDIAGRLVSDILSNRLGQQFAVEDKPGAGSNLGTEVVVNSPPDGYTLLLVTQSNAINATLYGNLSYDFIRDITPIATVLHAPSVLVINPSVPAKTIPELISYAKANPGKLNMGTAGIGSPPQLYGELFKMMTGINMTTVNYRGGEPGLVDLLAGQIQVMIEGITSSIGYIKGGKLRALGVTSGKRADALPGCSGYRRVRAWLRRRRLVRPRCAEGHTRVGRRNPAQGDQCRHCRACDESQVCRYRRSTDADNAG